MDYNEAVSFLLSRAHLGIKLGLGPINTLLSSLGHPEKTYPSLLIGGTNGKGSTGAMLASICSHAGLKVGFYTSPHLIRIEERITVSGEMISEGEFASVIERIKAKNDSLTARGELEHPLTYFELLTAAGFLYFAEREVDLAILEVGMGGRFDATNVVSPLVSVITQISRDHMEYLGESIADIAFEKAGIIKEQGRGAKPHLVSEETSLRLTGDMGEISTRKRTYSRLRLGLLGKHQWENARTAILTAELLEKKGLPLGEEAIKRGLSSVHWEGRLEEVVKEPRIIVDGAHNPAGSAALASFIRDEIGKRVILIFAAMGDKEIEKMGEILFPLARLIILPKLREARAAEPASIKTIAERYAKAITASNVGEAVKTAEKEYRKEETIVAAGSLYLVGEVKEFVSSRY